MPTPRFFQAADVLAFGERLRQHPQYDATDPADQRFAEYLVLGIFDKTKYWGEQVRDRLPRGRYDYEMRRTWQQGTHFRRYSWARLYLRGRRDKAFYFTLGVDSGETADAHRLAAAGQVPAGPALILKLDGHFATDGTLPQAGYDAGEALRQALPLAARWHHIGPAELAGYTWAKLVAETVEFVNRHEGDLRRIMDAAEGR